MKITTGLETFIFGTVPLFALFKNIYYANMQALPWSVARVC